MSTESTYKYCTVENLPGQIAERISIKRALISSKRYSALARLLNLREYEYECAYLHRSIFREKSKLLSYQRTYFLRYFLSPDYGRRRKTSRRHG